jgi:opacity protein-like surface antigen
MFASTRRLISVLGASAAIAVTGTVPAVAAGAEVFHDSACVDQGDVLICYTAHVTYHEKVEAGGQVSYSENGRYDYDYKYDDGRHIAISGSFHNHVLWKKGEQHVNSTHINDVVTTDLYTCTVVADVHYANGHIQYNDRTQACT